MNIVPWAGFALCLIIATGCGRQDAAAEFAMMAATDVSDVEFSPVVSDAIANADENGVSLVSVDPRDFELDEFAPMEGIPVDGTPRRWKILGESELEEGATNDVLYAVKMGIASYDDGDVAACFNPRHAIRIHSRGDTFEILICFECNQIIVFKNGEDVEHRITSDVPKAFFEQLVRETGLPSAEF